MKDDESLMRAYQAGSEEAFNLLYKRHSGKVYGFIKKRLRDDEVDDFFQKLWRQLHEKRHLYSGQPFLAWLFVLLRNLLTDEYRKLGRTARTREGSRVSTDPDEKVDLEEYLSKLSSENAELVREHYLHEKSFEEIAEALSVNEATLRKRVSRAMKLLKAVVKNENE